MSPLPKKFFHDRLMLLLLSVCTFLTILCSLLIVLHLSGGRSDGYIVQYRANLGISAFETGSSSELLAFIGFAVLVLVVNVIMSMRVYNHNRQHAIVIMSMGLLLLVVATIVSNALLVLR